MSYCLRCHGLQHDRLPCLFTVSWSLLKLMSVESVRPSNHLFHSCPLLLLPSIFPSIRIFSDQDICIYSFMLDWFDLLAVQGTLKSLLQHHNSEASILQCSASFLIQLSHPYMTTGKIIALTRWTLVGKVVPLLFNTLSRFVIAFLPRSKHLFILWLQSLFAVILEPKKIKSVTVSIVSPSTSHEVMGPDALIFVFLMLSFKPDFSLSFTFIKRLFSSFSLSAISVVLSAYLRLLIFLLPILIPACASSSPAFCMTYSAWKLNKLGWQHRALMYSFPNLEPVRCSMSGSYCCFLTCKQVSQEAGRLIVGSEINIWWMNNWVNWVRSF